MNAFPHLLAMVTGVTALLTLNVVLGADWFQGWVEIILLAVLMLSPVGGAVLAITLFGWSRSLRRGVVTPYVWSAVVGCVALALLAALSQSLADAEGFFPRETRLQQGTANLMFLGLLGVLVGVPVGVPLVRSIVSLRTTRPSSAEPDDHLS